MRNFSSDQLIKEIAQSCKGLVYVSETDSPIEVYAEEDEKIDRAYKAAVEKEEKYHRKGSVEISRHDILFNRLTTEKDWQTTEQKRIVKKFRILRELLEANLENLRMIRRGKVNIEIYVLGADAENNVIGIKMRAVET